MDGRIVGKPMRGKRRLQNVSNLNENNGYETEEDK